MKEDYNERYPLNGTFELTARCNLSCKMCFIRIDNKRMAELGGRERTADEWIHMAEEIQEAGTGALLLTGGEPLLRPDFIKIYKAIAQMGFMLTLYTNATLITDEIMEVFKEYPPHSIGITVYGASPETYEKVTGSAKAYYKMLEGVDKLKQLPSAITIRTTIIKDNLDDFNKMKEWASRKGDFKISRIVTKSVRGGVAEVEKCRLSPEESMEIIRERTNEIYIKTLCSYLNDNLDVDLIQQSSAECNINSTNEASQKHNYLYGCDAGIVNFTITWDGKLVGCQLLNDCWTYPFEEGFATAWEKYPQLVDIPPVPKECINCKVPCSACPANRLAETGALNGIPQYHCQESKYVNEMFYKLTGEIDELIRKE